MVAPLIISLIYRAPRARTAVNASGLAVGDGEGDDGWLRSLVCYDGQRHNAKGL